MDASEAARRVTDRFAATGKFATPDEHAQLLVVGAGAAGLTAAIRAAELGLHVVLVDENPVSPGLMGLDIPLFYGQRMTAAVQEPARMIERLVAATPEIAAAFDAGVDVRLGQTVWGVFVNGAALAVLPARIAGLSDGIRSWMCGFDALILATGARDLVLGFPGVDLPGVMGARAFHSLLNRYDAFDGKRLVVVGSGDLAVDTAHAALDRGLVVAAVLEAGPQLQAKPTAVKGLLARRVEIRTGVTSLHATGEFAGVAGVTIKHDGAETAEHYACDTLCLAIGLVPTIELAAALGCALVFRGDLGGHVPASEDSGATSLPGIFCAGDCAGLSCETESRSQGYGAANAAATWLGGRGLPRSKQARAPKVDAAGYNETWMRMLVASSGGSVPVCMCEEVTRAEFLGASAPRYLGWTFGNSGTRNTKTLLSDGGLNPDQLKRLTRAGMGVCQGRRCREQIALLLAEVSNTHLAEIPLASYRAPVRPLPLGVLADKTPQPDWNVWFGISTQWIPYNMIGTPAETALLEADNSGNMHA